MSPEQPDYEPISSLETSDEFDPQSRSIIPLDTETAAESGPAISAPGPSLIQVANSVASTAEAVPSAVGDSTAQSLTSHPGESRVAQSGVQPTKGQRGKLNEGIRQKANHVRKLGACVRCRVYHESCDDNLPCNRCQQTESSATIFSQPCYRESLDKIIAFRAGNSRANQTRSELPHLRWAVDDLAQRTIQVEYPFTIHSDTPRPTLSIICRKFTPRSTDILKDVWEGENGERLVLEFPPFACYDTDAATSDLEDYIEECSTLLDNDLRASVSEEISNQTLLEAKRFALANSDSCVAAALKIRLISYFCRESMIIVGDETLGIAKIEDTRFPIHGQVPVPSVLDFQIDTIAIHLMLKLIKSLVSRLKKIIYDRKNKEKWYEVYLTCFILFGCLEKVYSLQSAYMGMGDDMDKDIMIHVNYISRSMMDEWQYSANNLIFHFRCILRGMDPFSFDWEDAREQLGEASTANLDDPAILYLRRISRLLKEQEENIRGARNRTGAPLSWISELFLPDEDNSESLTSETEA